MEKNFLEIKQIVKSFDSTMVLKNVNLDVKEKEIVVLLGPSGCGKTTLLRIISGLLDPDGGSITLAGEDLLSKPVNEREIGFVFQKYALFPHMTVEENILFGLKLRKIAKDEMQQRLCSVLDLVELNGLNKRKISELSGGQQQRVALARALIIKPRLMLLDEPLSNLDAKLRASVRVNIVKILKKLGITAIMVTHDQTEAMTMGDRVVLLNDGVIQQEGNPKEIYRNPADMFVAEFLGSPKVNRIPVEILGNIVRFANYELSKDEFNSYFATLAEYPDGKYVLGVRPEHIYVSTDTKSFPSSVILTENCGADTYVHINLFGVEYVMRVDSSSYNFEQDQNLNVGFKRGELFLFGENGERVL